MKRIIIFVICLFLCAPALAFNQAGRLQGDILGGMKGSAANSREAELEIYRVLLPDIVLGWNCAGTCVDTSTEVDLAGNTITATSTTAGNKIHRHGGGAYYNFQTAEVGYFDAGDKDSFSFGDGDDDSPVTFIAWTKRTSAGSGPLALIKVNLIGGGEYGFGAPAGNIGAYLNDADSGVMNSIGNDDTALANDGAWHMIVVTYDGRGGQFAATAGGHIYYDGKMISSTASTDFEGYIAMTNTDFSLTIGGDVASFGVYPAQISAVFVVGKELSAGDVLDLYNKTRKFYQ